MFTTHRSTDDQRPDQAEGVTGRPRTNRARNLIAAGVAGAVMFGAVGVATAASGDGSGSGADLRPRIELACQRIPNLELRTNNVLERLQGDVDTLGSLEWLQRQIERARAQNREQLAVVLENRLEVRRALIPVLQQRLELLARLSDRCAEWGVDL